MFSESTRDRFKQRKKKTVSNSIDYVKWNNRLPAQKHVFFICRAQIVVCTLLSKINIREEQLGARHNIERGLATRPSRSTMKRYLLGLDLHNHILSASWAALRRWTLGRVL